MNVNENYTFCPFSEKVCHAVHLQRPECCPLALSQGSGESKKVMCSIKRIAIALARIEWNNKPLEKKRRNRDDS